MTFPPLARSLGHRHVARHSCAPHPCRTRAGPRSLKTCLSGPLETDTILPMPVVTHSWQWVKRFLTHSSWRSPLWRPVEVVAAVLGLLILVDIWATIQGGNTTIRTVRNEVLTGENEYIHDEVDYSPDRSRWTELAVPIGPKCTEERSDDMHYQIALYRAPTLADFRRVEQRLEKKENALANDPEGTWFGEDQGTTPTENLIGLAEVTRRSVPPCAT